MRIGLKVSLTDPMELFMRTFDIESAGLGDAKRALEENLSLLDLIKHKSARNMTIALAAIVRSQAKMQNDIDLFHSKLQPILKYLEEENADWRNRYSKYDE
jgi:hypothetical protein